MNIEVKTQVVVLGSGPAGYSSVFRCADLGLDTVLVERYSTLGGVCLNVGCIPSKALLHVAKLIEETNIMKENGIILDKPRINIDKICAWKNKIVTQLSNSLSHMAKMRKVKIVSGYGKFTSANTIQVTNKDSIITVIFEYAIIAAGSRSAHLSFIQHKDPRIWNSTDALNITTVPKSMLIIGGGIIGLEMAILYNALGSKIDIVEMFGQIIPAADEDIVNILVNRIKTHINLMLNTKITGVETKEDGVYVSMKGERAPSRPIKYDTVLVAIGRIPNSDMLDIEYAGVKVDSLGFIYVDKQMRTNVPHIYAVGDIVGHPMLAHKGMHEGRIAAEVISGKKHFFDPKIIPSIAYTEPEVAWVGITEKEAKEKSINYEVAVFPWLASGRAVASSCQDGITKLIFDKENHRIIGGAIAGTNGGELLGEVCLAIEMNCDAEDIAMTIHAHPTLHESVNLAAEIYEGTITDFPNFKINKHNKIRF